MHIYHDNEDTERNINEGGLYGKVNKLKNINT